MDEIKGQVIIEVNAPVRCLIDETKFRIPLADAVSFVKDLKEEIDKVQKPIEY